MAGDEYKEGDLSDNELFEKLEEELQDDGAVMAGYREQRLQQIKSELESVRALREDNHGRLSEIKIEKEVIQATLKNKRTILHFYHPDFRRCKLMDKHLEKLAAKHFGTKFIRVDVANVPFLVVKLEAKVLPCVICFVDGVSKDKIVGFETVGDGTSDTFTTGQLELRLAQSGVIETGRKEGAVTRPTF
ncbi:MAG: hypothetical protein CYPHOPRED_000132 [Cyphobasidiales sp. Tagirdzhanova-0007]|nr:MAG: hypothetical protein CYPHOPRED_000132 [Cyphobasidiales sp. Tagirdzhanova-0007]